MALVLETNAFEAGGRIPVRFTCDGDNASPPLTWRGAPEGTRSFAVICSDPDAPSGTFYHWAIYDIPARVNALAEGYPRVERSGPHQAENNFCKPGYDGPCPPPRHGSHHYYLRLYALPVEHLPVRGGARAEEIEQAASGQAIAQAKLVGTYSR